MWECENDSFRVIGPKLRPFAEVGDLEAFGVPRGPEGYLEVTDRVDILAEGCERAGVVVELIELKCVEKDDILPEVFGERRGINVAEDPADSALVIAVVDAVEVVCSLRITVKRADSGSGTMSGPVPRVRRCFNRWRG